VTLCKEDPGPLARYLAALRAGLDRAGLQALTQIFVLSDTSGADLVAREEAAFCRCRPRAC
jgi:membrane glycosyltransferase